MCGLGGRFIGFRTQPFPALTLFAEVAFAQLALLRLQRGLRCVDFPLKEELKTVGRDILACAQPNRYESFTAHWSPYRRVSSWGRRAQIRFGRGARGETPENDRPPFWFYGESIRTSVHGSHIVLLWKRHHRNAIVGTNMKYLCT